MQSEETENANSCGWGYKTPRSIKKHRRFKTIKEEKIKQQQRHYTKKQKANERNLRESCWWCWFTTNWWQILKRPAFHFFFQKTATDIDLAKLLTASWNNSKSNWFYLQHLAQKHKFLSGIFSLLTEEAQEGSLCNATCRVARSSSQLIIIWWKSIGRDLQNKKYEVFLKVKRVY